MYPPGRPIIRRQIVVEFNGSHPKCWKFRGAVVRVGRSFPGGYFTLVAASGREYLVNYVGRGLHSRVYRPSSWNEPFRSLGLRHDFNGIDLGRGGIRSVERRARHAIRCVELRLVWREFRDARDLHRLMRPITRWERFKALFVWGKWSWRTIWFGRDDFAGIVVVGKLKVYVPALRMRRR
jgi:hypothetical protein